MQIHPHEVDPDNDEDVEQAWNVNVEHDDGRREQVRVVRVRASDASITPRSAVLQYVDAGVTIPPRITISPDGVFPLIDSAE